MALLSPTSPVSGLLETSNPRYSRFFQELRNLGFVEGQNLTVDRHTALGDSSRYNAIVQAAVASQPDVIAVIASTPMALLLKAATQVIPIVAVPVTDPTTSGLVTNFSRPGGNLTAIALGIGGEIEGKRLEILSQAVPYATRAAYLVQPAYWPDTYGEIMQGSADRLGLSLTPVVVENPATRRRSGGHSISS